MNQTYQIPERKRSSFVWVPTVLACAAIVGLVITYESTAKRFENLDANLSKAQSRIEALHTDMRASSEAAGASHEKTIEALRQELQAARRAGATGVQHARSAREHADNLAKALAEQQQKQQEVVANELTEVKNSATTANAKIAEVSTEVGNVKTEMSAARSDIDKTTADLKRMTGDMGVMSGLIATNGEELKTLKALGDRHYQSFDLTKTKKAQRVGDILLMVKKTDPKRNRFTIEVIADDKTTEKKDKSINEPVQFYVASRARQPYEIVVNEVKPNRIVGYLSAPKVQLARQ
jgi:chromosome segregation ATPase